MALWGLPVEVIGGVAAGSSASFFVLVELPTDSSLAKALFGSRLRAVIVSVVTAGLIGHLVNPLAGVCFEVCFYPAAYIKSRQVAKALAKLARENPEGGEFQVEFPADSNTWHPVTIPPQPVVTGYF